MTRTTRQTLLFDADDTLWENNFLYERVIEDFLGWLQHPTMDQAELRRVLDDIERANCAVHGYGSKVFLRSLSDCFAALQSRPADAAEQQEIEALAVALLEHRIELVPGVADTLADLGARHDLHLVTKGVLDEQQAKLAVSGLGEHFLSVHVVAEKNVETYQTLTTTLALEPDRSWMIGNSPKSDISPARRAGLRAVYIPNESTWVLEQGALDHTDTGVLHVPSLRALVDHF